ncbi:recombinase family protein [Stenotrophomonas maltophilia]|uniref:recombinase family protein n=1 Tax=Stenotrophomonas maltophilia TaxID=40324 RepID=UPI0013DBC637|nr:recombinase family protein [Stenotrophomonas maltophilia]MDZ5789349.1 recombinase family protein [Stenotrophomonas maltophilia]
MSTEHQRYSTENQAQAISDYADANGIEIVRTCEDAGKSGLTLKGRPGLQALPRDVQEPGRNFDLILVYDVSRWGRFPDPDEAASYVYACKHQGVTIIYCAEPFQNDGSLPSAIMIGLKRGMAAEYSRELSTKVFRGACTIVQHGFRQGGSAGYGLRRQLLDGQHTPKGILDRGYWNKSWPHFRQIPALYRKGLVLPVFNLRSSKPTLEPAF